MVARAVGIRGKIHPATRTFQALRIAVNQELERIKAALIQAISVLEAGGRLVIISFHSLEDRMVKEFFAGKARACTCPPEFPVCVCGGKATGEIMTSKAVTPGMRELEANPRSSSAKLRALRRL